MHSYISSKKIAVGYGRLLCFDYAQQPSGAEALLLTDMGKDSSISLLATEATKRQKNFGKQ
jgi:hypothetical protein